MIMTHTMQHYELTVEKFLDHAAKWHGASEVVSAGPNRPVTRTTYGQLREQSIRLSGALLDRGLKPTDRIATVAWNTAAHVAMYYAAMAVGLVCHTLNPRLSIQQLSMIVNEAADRWIAVGADLQSLISDLLPLCPTIEGIILLDDQPEEIPFSPARPYWKLSEFLGRFGRIARWGEVEEDAPAGLCYTSGTTGSPRGVLYTHRSNYLHTLRGLQADALALTARDVLLAAVPMFHANGWGLPFAAPAVGAKMVLPGRSVDPLHLRELILNEGVTVAAAVPTVWLRLAELLEREGGELPSLERIVIGGSPCADALIVRMEKSLGVRVQTSWGMTELSPLGTIESPDQQQSGGPRGSGRPPLGLDLKLVDAEGKTLNPQRNVAGRLRVKGASVAQRYYQEEQSSLDEDGYFDTGDLAIIDDAGNLTITGRFKELIKSGGEWINPIEIERIVASQPGVALAAVVGCSDFKWGERPVLVVEPSGSGVIDKPALLDALRGKVPDWWIPDRVVVVERMPQAATGKIDKKRLREDLTISATGTQ
jgi:acyl-CoA synthetase (AMP-forming)/AMP-acid ligase II